MHHVLVDRAMECMQRRRFDEALPLLSRALDEDPSQWNVWYMAGQCCRFLDDLEGAIARLSRAAQLKKDEVSVFLALGIAFQLQTQWDDAIEAFRQALDIDADCALAYNSLALTQKKRGEFENALHNYDAGAQAASRRIVKSMRNSRSNPILNHRETEGSLWAGYATQAAQYLASTADGITGITWPTGAQAAEEARTERHAGLYWVDVLDDKRQRVRMFLPNYFNTFQAALRDDATYSNLMGNRGTVLELLGRNEEASEHFDEAKEFEP